MKGNRGSRDEFDDAFASAKSSERAEGPERAPIDPAREAARQAARRAFDARVRGTQVADLVHDSLIDSDQPCAEYDDVRHLRFVAGEAGVDLEVSDLHDKIHVALCLAPPRTAEVEVRGGDTWFVVFVGEDGRADFDLPRDTMTTLVIPAAVPGGRGLQTAWVRL